MFVAGLAHCSDKKKLSTSLQNLRRRRMSNIKGGKFKLGRGFFETMQFKYENFPNT